MLKDMSISIVKIVFTVWTGKCDLTKNVNRFIDPSSITVDEISGQYQKIFDLKHTLRKHAYSNIYKISPPKTENSQVKNSDIFHISAQNIHCGYPQSMFLSRNKKNNVYPYKPQFFYIKVGFKGVKII